MPPSFYTRHTVTPEDEQAVLAALRSPYLTSGPYVERFEEALALQSGATYAIAVNSGTAALVLAFVVLGKRFTSVPAISFVATANAALTAGAKVMFRDVSELTGLCTGFHGFPECIVTLGGQYPENWTAEIVDAAHGPIEHRFPALITTLSFHPAKFVACGEGGALLTNDAEIARRLRILRDHGRENGQCIAVGGNFRLPEVSAALGLSQLSRYTANVAERQRQAAVYDAALQHERITIVPHAKDSARHLYQVLVDDRDAVMAKLLEAGIKSAIHYPVIPNQPFYRSVGFRPGQYPGAERFAARCLALPLYPGLSEPEQGFVIDTLLKAVA